jgi:polyisoprenoid-binding protein YceI
VHVLNSDRENRRHSKSAGDRLIGGLPETREIARIRRGRTAPTLRAFLLILALGAGDVLQGQGGPADWRVDVTQSRLTVKVLPAGLLASTLHTHFFQPEDWSGEIAWDPSHPERVRVGVRIAADSLRDHQPKLSAKDIARVERQVRDAEILDAARFPEIRFEATRLDTAEFPSGAAGEFRGTLAGTLTLHRQSHPLQIPIEGRISADRLEANAAVTLKQSDFGIKPYSTALGTIAVRDEVVIEIALVALPRR